MMAPKVQLHGGGARGAISGAHKAFVKDASTRVRRKRRAPS
jgi:hypothetical protein